MKKSSVPRGEKGFCSWPPTWLLWRHVQTSNNCTAHTISKAFLFRKTTRRSLMTATYSVTLTAWGSAGLWFLMWFFRVNNLKCFISGLGVAKHHEIYFSFLLRPPVSRRSSSVSNKKGTKSARFEDHAMHYNGFYAEPSKKLEHVILGMKDQLDEIQKNLKGSSCKRCSNNTKG